MSNGFILQRLEVWRKNLRSYCGDFSFWISQECTDGQAVKIDSPFFSLSLRVSSATSAILRQKKQNLVWDGEECRRTSSGLHSYHIISFILPASSKGSLRWDKVMCLMFRLCLHSEPSKLLWNPWYEIHGMKSMAWNPCVHESPPFDWGSPKLTETVTTAVNVTGTRVPLTFLISQFFWIWSVLG